MSVVLLLLEWSCDYDASMIMFSSVGYPLAWVLMKNALRAFIVSRGSHAFSSR